MTAVEEKKLISMERKLDLILDALGLSENHRLAPVEVKQLTENILLKFEQRRRKDAKHGSQKN